MTFVHISMTGALSAGSAFPASVPFVNPSLRLLFSATLSLLSSQLKLSHFIRAGLHSRRSTKVESIYSWLPSQVASLPPQIIAQRIFHQNHLQIVEEFPAEGRKMHEPVTSVGGRHSTSVIRGRALSQRSRGLDRHETFLNQNNFIVFQYSPHCDRPPVYIGRATSGESCKNNKKSVENKKEKRLVNTGNALASSSHASSVPLRPLKSP